jgi:hypothetical protein
MAVRCASDCPANQQAEEMTTMDEIAIAYWALDFIGLAIWLVIRYAR